MNLFIYSTEREPLTDAVEAARCGWRILTPTSTMAEHLRHRLAREHGFVRPDDILTFSRFIEPLVREVPQTARPTLDRIVAGILESNPPEAYRPVAQTPGLRRTLVRLIEEVSSAGCEQEHLSGPFAEIFRAARKELARRGLFLRSERLALAKPAATMPFFLTGFYSFTPAELKVVGALGGGVTIVLPDWFGSQESRVRLREMGLFERQIRAERPETAVRVFHASTLQQEAEHVARRIVAAVAEGRAFREIGVLVRSEQPYVPLLETTFHRYGIPARFYFQRTLDAHPVARFYATVMDAFQQTWSFERLLPAIASPFSGIGGSLEADRLDHDLRARMPGYGLPELLTSWSTFEPWRNSAHDPAAWAGQLKKLRTVLRLPAISDGVPHEQALRWRETAAALTAFEEALDATAAALAGSGPMPLAEFRRHLDEVIALTPVSDKDQRRNVVHVMDVYEARQWRLPVVFLCGLTERVFPVYHSEHPVLDDAERKRLRKLGVVLRTSAERQREEEFLFDTAVACASQELVLSRPRTNASGDEVLPSSFLTSYERDHAAAPEPAVPSRPRPLWRKASPAAERIQDPTLLTWLHKNLAVLSPTSVESFLQCPFQFFARSALQLKTPPEAPADRLDALLQGDILHRALAESAGSPLFAEEIFARLFEESCARKSVPQSARTEKVRLELLANLRRFLESPPLAGGATVAVEHAFELSTGTGIKLRGKIDRVMEVAQRGLVVIDYKYSNKDRIRERVKSHARGRLVQGGLYLWAAEKRFRRAAAGMLYCGLRGEVSWGGWHLPIFGWDEIGESFEAAELRQMMETALAATAGAADRIHAGEVAPHPADAKKCAWCDYRDACRIETQPGAKEQVAGT